MFRDLLNVLKAEIDGRRAWDESVAVQAIDHRFTFSSFMESARHSAGRLRDVGLDRVEVLEAPADGRSIFGDWMMPLAWEVEEATFDLVGSNGTAERIADRAREPLCLAMWSAPTPEQGVEADIVWIENAADKRNCDPESVRGKIVFTSAHPHQAKRILLELGAVGILSDFQPPPAKLPDAVSWINAWSDDPNGWALTHRDTPAWAFVISPRQGDELRARLKAGEQLKGRALVRSSLGSGTLPVVTGVIPGSGKEEVLVLGHQFEVGAIDNASGIGIMIEVARALNSLVSEGRLSPPKRTIRFLFISECYTSLFWVETARRARRTVAGLCLDAACGSSEYAIWPLRFHANPHSHMSYTDALVLQLAREVLSEAPAYPWDEAAFAMTDNLIADTSIGIPCPWIGSHSRTWHSSADTPEMLDSEAQSMVARISAAYAYLNATADEHQIVDFAHLAAARGKGAIAAAGVAELARLDATELNDSQLQMSYLAERHAEAVGAVLNLLPTSQRAASRPQVRALQREVRAAGKTEATALARRAGQPGHVPQSSEDEGALATIHPRRLVKGPLTLDRIAPEAREGHPSPRWSSTVLALLSWCDGRRSLADVCHLTARELRTTRTLTPDELAKAIDPNLSSMMDYFEFLRRHDYVAW